MKVYIPFAAYVINNHFDQLDLIYLLSRVLIRMREEQTEFFPIIHENIMVRPSRSRLKFRITGIEKPEAEVPESEKIFPFCDFIVSVIYKNLPYSLEEMYQVFFSDLNVLKELKNLVKNSYLPGSLYSFKLFAAKLLEMNSNMDEPNIFMYDQLRDDGFLLEEPSEGKKKKVNLEFCCFCRGVNLEPMYFLSECECFVHKACFENEVIEIIEDFELNNKKRADNPHCSNPQNHISTEDLKVLVEIEKGRLLFAQASITLGSPNPTTVTVGNTLNTLSWAIGVAGTYDCTLSSYNGEFKLASFGSVTKFETGYLTTAFYKSLRFSGSDTNINAILTTANVVYRPLNYYILSSDTFDLPCTDIVELVCSGGGNTYNSEYIIGIASTVPVSGWIPFCTAGTECTSGRGNCNPLNGNCDCYYPYYGTNCELIDCGWCHNGGICDTSTGKCTCAQGYSGDNCEYANCPKGSLAVNCNNNGYCDIFSGVCICFEGYYGQTCNRKKCLNDCNQNGVCNYLSGTCACYSTYYGTDCAYRKCPRDCGAYGGCNLLTGECNCYGTFTEKDCMFSSCPNNCNSKGVCNYYSGTCECNTGYAGVDCSLTQA